jgi:hypothetical protein
MSLERESWNSLLERICSDDRCLRFRRELTIALHSPRIPYWTFMNWNELCVAEFKCTNNVFLAHAVGVVKSTALWSVSFGLPWRFDLFPSVAEKALFTVLSGIQTRVGVECECLHCVSTRRVKRFIDNVLDPSRVPVEEAESSDVLFSRVFWMVSVSLVSSELWNVSSSMGCLCHVLPSPRPLVCKSELDS